MQKLSMFKKSYRINIMKMTETTIEIKLSQTEHQILKLYANLNQISMTDAIKLLLKEELNVLKHRIKHGI